jgi:hypothetical protein
LIRESCPEGFEARIVIGTKYHRLKKGMLKYSKVIKKGEPGRK